MKYCGRDPLKRKNSVTSKYKHDNLLTKLEYILIIGNIRCAYLCELEYNPDREYDVGICCSQINPELVFVPRLSLVS
jgi:hypothetical protein